MADKDDSRPQISGLLGPGLVVAIASLVTYFSFEPRLQSQRPDLAQRLSVPGPPSPAGLSALHSRLWDDPLAVAYEHSKRHEGGAGKSDEVIAARLRGVDSVDKTEPDVRRYFQSVVANVQKSPGPGNGRFLCLPVLVHGEPYENDTEERKRITYAVVSALGAAGYELSYPDRLSYIDLPVWIDVRIVDRAVPRKLVVPVKLFRPSRVRPATAGSTPQFSGVQVFWINEDQLGDRPLAVIGQVLEELFGTVEQKDLIDVRILGPASSDTLVQMASENSTWTDASWRSADPPARGAYSEATQPAYFQRWHEATLFSGRATISVQALASDREKDGRKTVESMLNFVSGERTECGLTVLRTIGDDGQLARLIAEELHLRGAWPWADDTAQNPRGNGRQIVLITERDSSYGSLFPATFQNAFGDRLVQEHQAAFHDDILQEITYLRGLDGKIPGEKSGSDESRGEKSKSDESQIDPLRSQNPESIPASGRSQYDYLRRLERQLVELDRKSREQAKDGIVAIGVIGTDIYDKLLILRALRKRFPRTWFFSTNVDAELSQPGEYPTTRNLLVASHFGLTLNADVQRTAPPFRDSYQTSTYLSCLMALEDENTRNALGKENHSDPWGLRTASGGPEVLQPLMFEIGRSGPYQLTIPAANGASARMHPPGHRTELWLKSHWPLVSLEILLFALGWYFVHTPIRAIPAGPPSSLAHRALSVILVALLSGLACLAISMAVRDHSHPDGEPFVFFEGISIWPTTLVRVSAVIGGVVFVGRGLHNLQRQITQTLKALAAPAQDPGENPATWGSRLKSAIGLEWMMIVNRLRGSVGASNGPEDDRCFFHRLQRSGVQRLAVCIAETVPFLIFVALAFELTEWPAGPFRGAVSKRCATSAQFGGTFTLLVLMFFVLSALKLARLFVERVREQKLNWNTATIDRWQAERNPVCPGDLEALQTVVAIAELTDAIGKLVKFPLIVLFLIVAARHPAFDKLDPSWSLVVLWAMVVGGLLLSTYRLRSDAAKAHGQALDRLNDALSTTANPIASPDKANSRAEQLRQYISEIQQENRGAFSPWTNDPLIQALALGGSGGLLLIQQLLPYI